MENTIKAELNILKTVAESLDAAIGESFNMQTRSLEKREREMQNDRH